jgi:hypothetical protein
MQEPEVEEGLQQVFVVAKYRLSQAYGGPEEGGWWYTEHDFEKVVVAFTYEAQASAACRRLNAEVNQDPDGGSVYMVVDIPRWESGDGWEGFDDEATPTLRTDVPLHLPEHRPHYC